MISRVLVLLIAVMFTVTDAIAQRGGDTFNPLPQRTAETDREALRLMRNDKLDLVLPGAMRDNNVDMWIHVTRNGDPDPPIYEFGSTSGYLIFTDLGDRIERAVLGRRWKGEEPRVQNANDVVEESGACGIIVEAHERIELPGGPETEFDHRYKRVSESLLQNVTLNVLL